jgi:hypothetical protein
MVTRRAMLVTRVGVACAFPIAHVVEPVAGCASAVGARGAGLLVAARAAPEDGWDGSDGWDGRIRGGPSERR